MEKKKQGKEEKAVEDTGRKLGNLSLTPPVFISPHQIHPPVLKLPNAFLKLSKPASTPILLSPVVEPPGPSACHTKKQTPCISFVLEKKVEVADKYNAFLAERTYVGQKEILKQILPHPDLTIELLKRFIAEDTYAEKEHRKDIISPLSWHKKMLSRTGKIAEYIRSIIPNYTEHLKDIPKYNPREGDYKGLCEGKQIMALPVREKYIEQPHQESVRKWFRGHKRMLLKHSLGSGKTCTSTGCISEYIQENPEGFVWFLSPGGLRRNFIEEFCTFCPFDRRRMPVDYLQSRIRFVSLNDPGFMKKLPKSFAGSLIVIDEVHNINSALSDLNNEGKEIEETERQLKGMKKLYNALIEAGDTFKLLLMSGTPMERKLSDHYCLLSLLKPDIVSSWDKFSELFSENSNGSLVPKDKEYVKSLYSNCISCFKTPPELLPSASTETLELVQFGLYGSMIGNMYNIEVITIAKGLEGLMHEYMRAGMSRFAARKKAEIDLFRAATHDSSSRMSMLVYPKGIIDVVDDEGKLEKRGKKTAKEKRREEEEGEYREDEEDWWAETQLILTYGVDWIMNNSIKMRTLVEKVTTLPGKHSIYTPFKTKQGAYLIRMVLEYYGITCALYSGDLGTDNARSRILSAFNAKENANGDIIKALIITNAGNEGLTILDVRYVHILHQFVYETKIQQVIGRHVRLKSHDNLPPEKRTVHVFRYFSGDADYGSYEKGISRMLELKEINALIEEEFCIEKNRD